MNIFSIINNLYTNKQSDWISNAEPVNIQPFVIQRWLAMNPQVRKQTRWLDKYVFTLPPKMYLSLAWSILPKSIKAPRIKYIKKEDETEEFDFILSRVRKQFKLSDNDYNSVKIRILNAIKKDMINWFCFYGIPKKYWKKYDLDFKLMKSFGETKKEIKGLDAWGI